MTEEKWKDIIHKIKEEFEVETHKKEDLKGGGVSDFIIFKSPRGRIKLEWVQKPKVLDVKTLYTRRAGTSARKIDYVTSKDEMVQYIKAYLWNEEEDEWKETDDQSLMSL